MYRPKSTEGRKGLSVRAMEFKAKTARENGNGKGRNGGKAVDGRGLRDGSLSRHGTEGCRGHVDDVLKLTLGEGGMRRCPMGQISESRAASILSRTSSGSEPMSGNT